MHQLEELSTGLVAAPTAGGVRVAARPLLALR